LTILPHSKLNNMSASTQPTTYNDVLIDNKIYHLLATLKELIADRSSTDSVYQQWSTECTDLFSSKDGFQNVPLINCMLECNTSGEYLGASRCAHHPHHQMAFNAWDQLDRYSKRKMLYGSASFERKESSDIMTVSSVVLPNAPVFLKVFLGEDGNIRGDAIIEVSTYYKNNFRHTEYCRYAELFAECPEFAKSYPSLSIFLLNTRQRL